jgi:hypothetical protein
MGSAGLPPARTRLKRLRPARGQFVVMDLEWPHPLCESRMIVTGLRCTTGRKSGSPLGSGDSPASPETLESGDSPASPEGPKAEGPKAEGRKGERAVLRDSSLPERRLSTRRWVQPRRFIKSHAGLKNRCLVVKTHRLPLQSQTQSLCAGYLTPIEWRAQKTVNHTS